MVKQASKKEWFRFALKYFLDVFSFPPFHSHTFTFTHLQSNSDEDHQLASRTQQPALLGRITTGRRTRTESTFCKTSVDDCSVASDLQQLAIGGCRLFRHMVRPSWRQVSKSRRLFDFFFFSTGLLLIDLCTIITGVDLVRRLHQSLKVSSESTRRLSSPKLMWSKHRIVLNTMASLQCPLLSS